MLILNCNFIQARYNLKVSYIKIDCYEEAAQHLLGALSMHQVIEREGRERVREVVGSVMNNKELDNMINMNQSTNLYETLMRVFSLMKRRNLSDLIGLGIDIDVFQKQFNF